MKLKAQSALVLIILCHKKISVGQFKGLMNRVRIFTRVREVNNFSNMYKNCVQLYKKFVHKCYCNYNNNIILLNIIKIL